ncbi:MAG TPA: GMP synthase (glutamine-hydrolyzing), partial [Clostridiales bacterium]|nr:GMP synthase (glutamine-hydrolyzing) [Clostridiales bacterium]
MSFEQIVILDFGGQYNQLIARRVREAHVYCEVLPYNTSIENIRERNPKGIIFTGGPASVLDESAPCCDAGIFSLGIPVLGICYGMQLMAVMLGGSVTKAEHREYGNVEIDLNGSFPLFHQTGGKTTCWMSHTYQVDRLPEGFKNAGFTKTCPTAAMVDVKNGFYGVQFHPEVNHTPLGQQILENFLYRVCGLSGNWIMSSVVAESIRKIREKAGKGRVLCALSGGVDSSV